MICAFPPSMLKTIDMKCNKILILVWILIFSLLLFSIPGKSKEARRSYVCSIRTPLKLLPPPTMHPKPHEPPDLGTHPGRSSPILPSSWQLVRSRREDAAEAHNVSQGFSFVMVGCGYKHCTCVLKDMIRVCISWLPANRIHNGSYRGKDAAKSRTYAQIGSFCRWCIWQVLISRCSRFIVHIDHPIRRACGKKGCWA